MAVRQLRGLMVSTLESHDHDPKLKFWWNLFNSVQNLFFPFSFPVQLLQHQHHWKCLTWDLCVHTCVNTHKIKNSFRASIPVGEMAKAGILLVITWLLVQWRIWLESSPEWARALATERTGNDLLTMTVRRWCACGSPLLHSLCRPPVDTGLQHTRVQVSLCAIWTKGSKRQKQTLQQLAWITHTHKMPPSPQT